MRFASGLTGLIFLILLATTVYAADRPAKTVAEIFDQWAKRSETIQSGKIGWTIPLELGNRFGRFETEWIPMSSQSNREIGGSLQFDRKEALYQSSSFSYPVFELSPEKSINEFNYFRGILYGNFKNTEAEYRDLLSYRVLYSATKRIHHWYGGKNDYPRALILPVSQGPDIPSLSSLTAFNLDSADHASGGPSSELHEWLAAPILLAYRPHLFDEGFARKGACQLNPNARPTYEGHVCQVIHVAAPTKKTYMLHAPFERIYWVDPDRDFLVVRCQLLTHGYREGWLRSSIQLDVHYEQVEGLGWVPDHWTVMKPAPDQCIIQQFVKAQRTTATLQQDGNPKPVHWEFTPRTWVKDKLTKQQFFVKDDLTQQEIKEPYSMAYTYPDLIDKYVGDTSKWSFENPKDRRQMLLTLTHWPGILIPVGTILVFLVAANILHFLRRKAHDFKALETADPLTLLADLEQDSSISKGDMRPNKKDNTESKE